MADTYFDHPFRRGVYASLARMNASLTSDMRARVRGSGSMLPIQVVHALATLPVSETDSFDRRPVWEIALRAFGTVVHGNGSVGSVLAQTDYPEARVNALLASRGDQTVRLVSEVSRWLVARDVYAVDLTSLVVMALAEIDGDMRLHRMASGSIALDYARVIAARKRAAA